VVDKDDRARNRLEEVRNRLRVKESLTTSS
jgi:hypothetical protein